MKGSGVTDSPGPPSPPFSVPAIMDPMPLRGEGPGREQAMSGILASSQARWVSGCWVLQPAWCPSWSVTATPSQWRGSA